MPPTKKTLWSHFDDTGNHKARCKICESIISYKTSVSNLAMHMLEKHCSREVSPECSGSFAFVEVDDKLANYEDDRVAEKKVNLFLKIRVGTSQYVDLSLINAVVYINNCELKSYFSETEIV